MQGRGSKCKAKSCDRRTIDVVPLAPKILNIHRFDLISQQHDGIIECAIIDGRWKDRELGRTGKHADTQTSVDLEGHICRCLELLKAKLAPGGFIFLFGRPDAFDDPRVPATCSRLEFKQVGKIIWQRKSGGFRDADLMPRVVHEEIHIICHSDCSPKSLSGSFNSVTPKITCVQLMELLIKISTANGRVVDLFAGSAYGATAAIRLNRPYVGAEPVREIADAANQKLALAKGENDEVREAVAFTLDGASAEQREVICEALAQSGLGIVATIDGGIK